MEEFLDVEEFHQILYTLRQMQPVQSEPQQFIKLISDLGGKVDER